MHCSKRRAGHGYRHLARKSSVARTAVTCGIAALGADLLWSSDCT